MSLAKFEARMMRLKGVKLPAQGLVESKQQSFGRPAKVTQNRHQGSLLSDGLDDEFVRDEAMDDILVGIVRSFDVADSHNGLKLNVAVVRNMMNKLPEISSQSIMDNFGYSSAHARRYAQACRLVMQHKNRHDIKQLKRYAE